MTKTTKPQTNSKTPKICQFQQMIHPPIFQNSLTINTTNTEEPTFCVNKKIQKSIPKTQINLHK